MNRASHNHLDSSESESEQSFTDLEDVTSAAVPTGPLPSPPSTQLSTQNSLTEKILASMEEEVDKATKKKVIEGIRFKESDLRGELTEWQKHLVPYDWRKITPKIMHTVLAKINLAKGFNRQKQVRMYELLRCLGSDIVELELTNENSAELDRIKKHFKKYSVEKEDYWFREEDTIRVDINTYLNDARGPPIPQQALTVIKDLGFSLQEIKNQKKPLCHLGALVLDLLKRAGIDSETEPQHNDDGTACLLRWARNALEENSLNDAEEPIARSEMQRFLQDVAEDYHRKNKAWERHLEDDSGRVRSGREPLLLLDKKLPDDVRTLLQKFTPDENGSPGVNLHELAPSDIELVLDNVIYAWKTLGRERDIPKKLNEWSKRNDNRDIGIAHYEELARDLGTWFSANTKALAIKSEATVQAAVNRGLMQCTERNAGRHASLNSGTTSLSTTAPSREAMKDRIVAVFGASRTDGQRLTMSDSPVVVHRIPFNLSSEDHGQPESSSTLEIREVGIRLEGSFTHFASESGSSQLPGDADGKSTEYLFFEWVPPGKVHEASKPLMKILNDGVTHVQLILPNSEDDDPIEISLRNPCDCKADSLTYKLIPSKPRDAAALHESPGTVSGGFRRLVLQVGRDLNISLPESLRTGSGTGGAGFVETGAVVAQALRIFLGQRQTIEDIAQHLRDAPDLLYYTSIALLESVSPNAREVVKVHWERELRLDCLEIDRMSIPERESREVLRDLLIAREAGRDKLCGVLPEAHCAELVRLLGVTKHAVKFMSVETSNLDSRLVEMDALLTDSVICILIVTVTGSLDPTQVAQIIHRTCGCIRLVFVDYASLLPSLGLDQLLDMVIVPPSLEGHRTERIRPTYYSPTSAVGLVVSWSHTEFYKQPCNLLDYVHPSISAHRKDLEIRCRWQDTVAEWCGQPHRSHPLLMLISADERHIERHFDRMKAHTKVFIFDDARLPQMEKLLARHAGRGAESEKVGTDAPPIIVLGRMFLVKTEILEALVKACFLKGFKLVIAMKQLRPEFLRVAVRIPGSSDRHYVEATLVRTRHTISDQDAFADQATSSALHLFRALCLALGPDFATCGFAERVLKADREFSHEKLIAECDSKHAKELVIMMQGMLQERDDAQQIIGEDHKTMAFRVGQLLMAAARQLPNSEIDISFLEFSQLAVCRFLPQAHRVEAWLRYIASELKHCPVPELRGSQHVVATQWSPADNMHGSSLAEVLRVAGPGSRHELPCPCYIGTGRADIRMSQDAVYQRCALQGKDLDWELFAERWTHAYDLNSKVVTQLLRFSPDIGRLILCMPPSQIANLGTLINDEDTHRRILDHFEQIYKLLLDSESVSNVSTSVLEKRRVAWAWVLRNSSMPDVRERMQQLCGAISSHELDVLVGSHIMLRTGEDDMLQQLRVVELLVGLDDDVQLLNKQADVRDFLLQTESDQLTEMLGCTKIGAVFIHFLLSSSVRDALRQGREGFALIKVPFFQQLLAWAAGSEVAFTLGPTISEAALAAIIELAPGFEALPAVTELLWEHAQRNDTASFLSTVVITISQQKPHSVVPVFEGLLLCRGAREVELVVEGSGSSRAPLAVALWDALRHKDLGIYLQKYKTAESNARLPLSLDGSHQLRLLYLQHFAGKRAEADLQMHIELLTDPGSSALYTDLLQLSEEKFREQRALIWQCWARAPERQLPYKAWPQRDDEQIFIRILRSVDFWDRCKKLRSLSVVARFLVEPFILPLQVYNRVAAKIEWVHGGAIPEKMCLLGQEGHHEWLPYLLRYHSRPLPDELKQQLRCSPGKVDLPPGEGRSMKEYPRITEGVSPDLLKHNIRVLFAMRSMKLNHARPFAPDVQRSFVGVTIRMWLKAAGLSKEDVKSCVAQSAQSHFDTLWAQIDEDFSKGNLRSQYVHGPLPAQMEVYWNAAGSNIPLFAVTKESGNETAQWANLLISTYKLDPPEVHASELVRQCGERESDVQCGKRFKELLPELARSLAIDLRLKSTAGQKGPKTLVVKQSTKHDAHRYEVTKLVEYMSVIATFTGRLRESDHQLEKTFFKNLVGGLDGLPEENSAAVFDACFVLYNVTPLNHGRELGLIAAEFRVHALKASSQACSEAGWMKQEYYLKHMKDDHEVLRNLDLILNLDRCEFHRHCGGCDFVGEVLKPAWSVPRTNDYEFKPMFRNIPTPQRNTLSSGETSTRPRHGAGYDAGAAAPIEGDEDNNYFIAAGQDEQRSVAARELPLVSLPFAGKGVSLVAASCLLKIDFSESMYMHGVLRVRPGLQPLLRDDEDEDFLRLAPVGPKGATRKKKDTNIVKAFPNNGDAWDYLNSLPAHSIIMCDGFYIVKADNCDIMLPVLASKHKNREHKPPGNDAALLDQRNFVWPFVHAHRILRLDEEVSAVLRIIVFVAWRLTQGSEEFRNEEPHDGAQEATVEVAGVEPNMNEDEVLINAANVDDTVQDALRNFLSDCDDVKDEDVSPCLEHIAMRTLVGERREGSLLAGRQVQTLRVYHRHERAVRQLVTGVVATLQEGGNDLVESVLREACYSAASKSDNATYMPFTDNRNNGVSFLGARLSQLLASIMQQNCDRARTVLSRMLSVGEHDRIVAPHHHLTKLSSARISTEILRGIEKNSVRVRGVPNLSEFSDSEDSDRDETFGVDNPDLDNQAPVFLKVGEREVPMFQEQTDNEHAYIDAVIDRDNTRGAPLLPEGFGRPVISRYSVLSFYDADVPLYFVPLSRQNAQLSYSMADGLPLGFLLHKNLIGQLLIDAWGSGSSAEVDCMMSLRGKLLHWVADVIRSPLSDVMKRWILEKTEKKGLTAVQPPQDPEHVNLAIIAFCLCRCCPSDTKSARLLREMLSKSWNIPRAVRQYIERKSDMYGVYIVKGGTLTDLKLLGLHVSVRDFERVVAHGSLTNAAMYLEIIRQFSDYCCIVYVQGLGRVQDPLLKWLAEYTRHHPWRFVYLENVDVSWNYSENRDRCNFVLAPPNPAHLIQTAQDLSSPHVVELRPSHSVSYDVECLPPSDVLSNSDELTRFFRKSFAPRDGSGEGIGFFKDKPTSSLYQSDFRKALQHYVLRDMPSLVLLVSPPGAGKTYYMAELQAQLTREKAIGIEQFDGSSDILVHHTLAELLNRAVTARVGLLVVDEYHMLSDDHKEELYAWLHDKLGVLRVVLIANRIDSRDRDRLRACQRLRHEDESTPDAARTIVLLEARLTRSTVMEVMEKRSNTEQVREAVGKWLVGSRLAFGEESVSLRLVDQLDRILSGDPAQQQARLVELLLNKVPTISRVSAEDFVATFLRSTSCHLPVGGDGPFATLLHVALFDKDDDLCSLPEFLTRVPRAYDAPPAVRLLAWATYAINALKDRQPHNAAPSRIPLNSILASEFVDQVGVPFQLRDVGGNAAHGSAFTWSGDYSSLDGLIDAVKHGHSIDWADVGDKEWSRNPITDGEALCRLLSSTRNPSKLLEHLSAINLASLLRRSTARVANDLARNIIKNQSHIHATGAENPFYLSVWTLLRHDPGVATASVLIRIVEGEGLSKPVEMLNSLEWAQQYAQDLVQTTCDPRQRHLLLQRCLVLVSKRLPGHPDVSKLWSGPFARLMLLPTRDSEGDDEARAMPAQIFYQVMLELKALSASWKPQVQIFWRILHCRATAMDINELWQTDRHVFFCGKRDEGMPAKVVEGILNVTVGQLEADLQKSVLTTKSVLSDGISEKQVLSMLPSALRTVQRHEVQIVARPELQAVIVGGLALSAAGTRPIV